MDAASDLQSWQQAFEQHPIATTRAIEKQLRASVANNKEKLRVLVGGNYRQLLSTAEQIVALDGQTKSAESHISEISQHCNPPSQKALPDQKASRKRTLSQLRLLQKCLAAAKSALSKGELLQSAHFTVISRLLLKSLNDEEPDLKSLSQLRENATSVRRQLLRRVDITLASPRSVLSTMVQGSCSYCLLTSASFQDVFRHVHQLRLERLRKSLDAAMLSERHVTDGLRYHVTSLRMLTALTGRAMTDALGSLQKRPIFQEPGLIDSELLDLKGIGPLIPEEIRSFIPYFKRSPFTSDEVRQTLQDWSASASRIIADGLQRFLVDRKAINSVLDLRKELFSILLPVYFTLPGSSSLQQSLHKVLSARLELLCQSHVSLLLTYTNEALHSPKTEPSAESLWQADFARMPLDNGASRFLQQVRRRRRGKSLRLARASRPLEEWTNSTKELLNTFQNLRSIRWRDTLEEPDDEQEEDAETIVKSLSQEDPDLYSSQIQSALRSGFGDLEDKVMTTILESIEQGSEAREAVEHLRLIRELVAPLRQAFAEEATFKKLDELIPRLHQIISDEVVARVFSSWSPSKDPVLQQEGNSIENMPSPQTFRFLHHLCTIMLEVGGTDIWSPAAVRELKAAAVKRLWHEDQKQLVTKREFDEAYLSVALGASSATFDEDSEQARAGKEYWSRTKLLFGVLLD